MDGRDVRRIHPTPRTACSGYHASTEFSGTSAAVHPTRFCRFFTEEGIVKETAARKLSPHGGDEAPHLASGRPSSFPPPYLRCLVPRPRARHGQLRHRAWPPLPEGPDPPGGHRFLNEVAQCDRPWSECLLCNVVMMGLRLKCLFSELKTLASLILSFYLYLHVCHRLTFDAYVAGKENAPGIVVLQEWWGVDFEVKNNALKIASLEPGYKVLIPDLYRGKVGLDVAEAQHLMEGLDWQGAVNDIKASAKWLKSNGSQKVGVTGFCMGGALSIASAVLVPGVDAVVAFYGVPSSELADPSLAKAPVQAHFGELDNFVGFSDVTAAKALEEKLKSSGIPFEVYIYPGCRHAFLNTSPDGVKRRNEMGWSDEDPKAVKLAWSRFSSWMDKYMSA